jgi:hypothetical protein
VKKLDIIIKISGDRLRIPNEFKPTFQSLLDYCNEKRGGYLRMQLSPPFKHRSTGENSQNHHINGHCQQIANETGEEFDVIKAEAKRRAIKWGYPIRTNVFGEAVPLSETELDPEQAGFLIESLHEIAGFLEVRLKENNDA